MVRGKEVRTHICSYMYYQSKSIPMSMSDLALSTAERSPSQSCCNIPMTLAKSSESACSVRVTRDYT